MKTITFYYEHCCPEQFGEYLEFLCREDPEELVIYSIFSHSFTGKEPEEIVNFQRKVSANRRIRFRNHGVFRNRVPLSRRALNALADRGFRVELLIEDPETDPKKLLPTVKKLNQRGIYLNLWNAPADQKQTYEKFRTAGLPVCFSKPEYTSETKAWFDTWVFDKGAVGVNTFTDIMGMLLLGIRSHNCRYSSCVGNTYYADGKGRFYLCPIHLGEETCLGTMEDMGALSQSFGQPTTYKVLLSCVNKREACLNNCQVFSCCYGGCPMETEKGENCSHYATLVTHIGNTLREIYEKDRLGDVNPVVRSAILNAIAFDSAFIRT